jgi:hypothetical protein
MTLSYDINCSPLSNISQLCFLPLFLVNPSWILAEFSSLQFYEINQPANRVGRKDSEFFLGKEEEGERS